MRTRDSALAISLVLLAGCNPPNDDGPVELSYRVPLQHGAYWPKFRRTAGNSGFTPLRPGLGQTEVWKLSTGKGIFSSPVIDADGTIYFGSANAKFYAVRPDGTVKWSKQLGELVDSSALIDADGTIFVGSGDGNLYAFTPDGDVKWTFKPRGGAYITWFEGNVAIGPDGTLYAGNDDFHLYAIDRADGQEKWSFKVTDQIWSGVAVDRQGMLYFGSNDLKLHAVDPSAATPGAEQQPAATRWSTTTLGSLVSSPLVIGSPALDHERPEASDPARLVVAGSFDGYARGFDPESGKVLWRLPAREHIYASAALTPDGTITIPSADGTLYAVDDQGQIKWTFDTLDPIRSSPAVGGDGTIYFGGGDGRLYAIDPDGTRRWSFDTSESDRNDLNASPALGKDAIYIAGEDGNLWSIPYDYCLRDAGTNDTRCSTRKAEDLADDGARVYYLSPGGASHEQVPRPLGVSEVIALRLVVRQGGDTIHGAIDPQTLEVTITPAVEHQVSVSAKGTFVVLVPSAPLAFDTEYTVALKGDYLVEGFRLGNKIEGGRVGGGFEQTLRFRTRKNEIGRFPLAFEPDRVPVIDISRLAAPQPTLLPSYNQIGFDFMHLLLGLIEHDPKTGRVLGWVTAARRDGERVIVDASSEQRILFPVAGTITGDSLVLESASFAVEFAQVTAPIDYLRLGGALTETGASTTEGISLYGRTTCKDVEYYGSLLEIAGLCNPSSGQMVINGTAIFAPASEGGEKPAGLTVAAPELVAPTADAPGHVTVTLDGTLPSGEHVLSLLLLDRATRKPLPINYSQQTANAVDAQSGKITGATLTLAADDEVQAGTLELVVLHDLYPLARFEL